jgi:hypothetical protein
MNCLVVLLVLSAGNVSAAFKPMTALIRTTQQQQQLPMSMIPTPITTMVDRRTWLSSAAPPLAVAATVELILSVAQVAAAATDSPAGTTRLQTFTDVTHGFSIKVPSEWIQSEQTLPDRRKLQMWMDPNDSTTLLFIAYTPVRDDFTSLSSFGSVDDVAARTVLPKGELMGKESDAQMLSAVSENQKALYLFDYTQSVPAAGGKTHFRSLFTMRPGAGAGAVLVTITAQTPEARYAAQLMPVFDTVIQSYAKTV